jgi:SAM-dependent methyltransferase
MTEHVNESLKQFLTLIGEGISNDTFVRLTLSAPQQKNADLSKVIIRLIDIKNQQHLNFTFRHKTRDVTVNNLVPAGLVQVKHLIESEFRVATFFSTEFDVVIERNGLKYKLRKLPPSFADVPVRQHDKQKNRVVESESSGYFHLLGLAGKDGKILASGQDKFRQIQQYIHLLSNTLKEKYEGKSVKVFDMGSGKGYLTFALYDFLTNVLKSNADVTGIEMRKELVEFCNTTAQKSGFQNLRFEQSDIQSFEFDEIDVLVALHACDTATDEAIAAGITSNASVIVVAPCCHKQIRKEIEQSKVKHQLEFVTRHGIFLERQAEMLTDAMRVMILELFAYKVKVVEFIADAHTHKNVMIIASKGAALTEKKRKSIEKRLFEIKQEFGITEHHLIGLLHAQGMDM